MLRFLTAGESHGPELVAVVEGYPAGFEIDLAKINHDLARRQKGYGRGGRMKIERDEVRVVSGVRFGRSMGTPITLIVENRDCKNWLKRMSVDPADRDGPSRSRGRVPATPTSPACSSTTSTTSATSSSARRHARPRCGSRSARSPSACCGPSASPCSARSRDRLNRSARRPPISVSTDSTPHHRGVRRSASPTPKPSARSSPRSTSARSPATRSAAWSRSVATGLPPGLGSHVHWDRKLDGRLAHALLSLQAVKGVEIGLGFEPRRRAARRCTTRSTTTTAARVSSATPTMPAAPRAA